MNDKLQRIYYIIGIIQRISMVVLTICMIGAAYKIYDLSLKYGDKLDKVYQLVEKLYNLIHKSWLF
jgi:hypothetical protein